MFISDKAWDLYFLVRNEKYCLPNTFHFKVPYVYCEELSHGQWRNLCFTFSVHLSDYSDGYHIEYNIDGIIDCISYNTLLITKCVQEVVETLACVDVPRPNFFFFQTNVMQCNAILCNLMSSHVTTCHVK